jgi:hypothetical protein
MLKGLFGDHAATEERVRELLDAEWAMIGPSREDDAEPSQALAAPASLPQPALAVAVGAGAGRSASGDGTEDDAAVDSAGVGNA